MDEKTLFHEALSHPAGERTAFLDAACADRPGLRASVEALLRGHEASGPGTTADLAAGGDPAFGATGDYALPRGAPAGAGPLGPGVVIGGRYVLVEKLGEGGMGEVWTADQTEPVKRKVALKLVKTGMDSAAVLARFEAERQALALMDHPGIARVLDGGLTPHGQPFFVMELVQGQTLMTFCEERRLTIRQRLELFVPICQAVQHAHSKGIVHRDLKPANILVTMVDGKAVPRVIDFGLAKAMSGDLTEEGVRTQAGGVIGTLEYMAPEQAAGTDLDTRADVYSLGVILYELLAGTRPFDSRLVKTASMLEFLRLIQETEPPRPSARVAADPRLPALAGMRRMAPAALAPLLRGELDWVAMKSLEKRRERRYETASALAADLQRHLADEPVEARPPSVGYRLGKFLARNRVLVSAAALVLLSLIAGGGLAIWQAVVARQARDDALALVGEKSRLADDNAALAKTESEARAARELELRRSQAVLFGSQIERSALIRERSPWAAYAMLYDLSFCPVEQRDLAWNAAVAVTLRQRIGTFGTVGTANALSPDGKILAVATSRDVRLLAIPSSTTLARLPRQGDRGVRVVFSPDSNTVAIISGDPMGLPQPPMPGTAQLFDTAGKNHGSLEGHTDRVAALAFSPDGKTAVTGSGDGTARVWDLATFKQTHLLGDHGKPVAAVAFSPDGKTLATGGFDHAVRLWDSTTFQNTATWKVESKPTAPGLGEQKHPFGAAGVVALDFSPNGKTLAVASSNRVIEFREVAGGALTAAIRDLPLYPRSMQFSHNGAGILLDAVRAGLWDIPSGKIVREFTAMSAGNVAFSRNTGRVAIGGSSFDPGQMYDLGAPLESARLPLQKERGAPPAAAFTPTGDLFAAAGTKGVLVWDVATRRVRHTLAGHRGGVKALAISPDARLLVSGDRAARNGPPAELRWWDLTTGDAPGRVELGAADVRSIDFSPDGRSVASFHWNREDPQKLPTPVVTVWDAAGRKLRYTLEVPPSRWEPLGADHPKLRFHPSGRTLILASGRQLCTWDLETRTVERTWLIGTAIEQVVAPPFMDLAVSADGIHLATSHFLPQTGPEVRLWDLRTGQQLHKISAGEGSAAGFSVRFSPDGKTLLVGGEGVVRFLDVRTMQTRGALPVPGYIQQAVFLSPDGRTLAALPIHSVLFDRDPAPENVEAFLWDIGPPATRLLFPGRLVSIPLRLTRDGTRLIQNDSAGVLNVWETETGKLLGSFDTRKNTIGLLRSPDDRFLAGSDLLAPEDERRRALDPNVGPEGWLAGKYPAIVTLLDLRTLDYRRIEVGKGRIDHMIFSRDGTRLLFQHNTTVGQGTVPGKQDYSVEVLTVPEGRSLGVFPFPGADSMSISCNPTGSLIAVKLGEGVLRVIEPATQTVGPVLDTAGRVRRWRFSADGSRLVIDAAVWDWRNGKRVEEPIPADVPVPKPPAQRFRLVATPLGTTLVDLRIQPPAIGMREAQP